MHETKHPIEFLHLSCILSSMPPTTEMLESSFYALSYYAKLIKLLLMMSKLFSNKVLSKLGFSNNKESDLQQIRATEII
jgi:hypothetical protein